MGEGLNLPEEYYDLPLRILGPSTRRLLSIHLDPPAVIPTSHGVLGDLSGLAELAGFEFCHIRYFETKQSRTFACLEEWGSRQSGTIGNLMKNLIIMERFDCLSEIRESVLRDINNQVERLAKVEEKKINLDQENNLVKLQMSTNIHTDPKDRMNHNHVSKFTHIGVKGISATESTDEQYSLKPSTCGLDSLSLSTDEPDSLKPPTTKSTDDDSGYITAGYSRTISIEDNREVQLDRIKSVIEGHKHDTSLENCNITNHAITPIYEDDGFLTIDDREGQLKIYNACICCADENLDLANTIINKYKKEHDADFFLPQEALLSGRYEFECLAEVIETRCDSRVIVILSKHYINSPACVFATQFVKTLDPAAKCRKIIPVLLDEDVPYPRVLRGISSIKARRLNFGNAFWNLLSSSLRLPKVVDDENNLMNTNIKNKPIMDRTDDENVVEPKPEKKKYDNDSGSHTSSFGERNITSIESEVENSSLTSNYSVSDGAVGTKQHDQYPNNTAIAGGKKKNPRLRTLRRIMKSLNIIDRKPKLQYTKRSHSTGETMESSPAEVHLEPRSHSTTVPPYAYSHNTISEDINDFSESKQILNICHTESELTHKDHNVASCSILTHSYSENVFSKNNFDTSDNDSLANLPDCCDNNVVHRNNLGSNTGQNILSPNIDPISSKKIPFDCNDLESTSRQTSYDNNAVLNSPCASFENTSLLSEITSSDNNSIISPSRKASIDNNSVASSFRQMSFGNNSNNSRNASFDSSSRQTSLDSNSRQPSLDSNSRQTSFDRTSLTSVEDNATVDKQATKSCWNEKEQYVHTNITTRQKSDVIFEIML